MGSQYCVAHKCKRRCNMKRCGRSEFCSTHKCAVCDGATSYSFTFCIAHKCRQEDCSRQRDGSAEYCVEHHCRLCSGEQYPRSQFCIAHKCIHSECYQERDGAETCKEHSMKIVSEAAMKIGRFDVGRFLGSGSFSQVRLGVDSETGETVALKIMSITAVREMKCEDLLASEITLLQNINHENVIHLTEAVRTTKLICVVLEFSSGGELFDLISRKGALSDADASRYMTDLMKGVCHLHAHGVAHRDIKPENLLLQEGVLKIADLGFASYQEPREKLKESLGTPEYQAPEVTPLHPYDGFCADIWSCGIVLFTMVCAVLPFDGMGDDYLLQKEVEKGISVPAGVAAGPKALILACVVTDPMKRPTAYEILTEDAWIGAGAGSVPADLAQANTFPIPRHKVNPLSSLRLVAADNEGSLFTAEEHQSWTLSKLFEEAAGFIEALSAPKAGSGKKPSVCRLFGRLRHLIHLL